MNKMNFLKEGENTLVKIKVIDKDKAFGFIGRASTNRLDTTKYGFEVESLYLSEDKYREELEVELREEIQKIVELNLANMKNEIDKLIK